MFFRTIPTVPYLACIIPYCPFIFCRDSKTHEQLVQLLNTGRWKSVKMVIGGQGHEGELAIHLHRWYVQQDADYRQRWTDFRKDKNMLRGITRHEEKQLLQQFQQTIALPTDNVQRATTGSLVVAGIEFKPAPKEVTQYTHKGFNAAAIMAVRTTVSKASYPVL
jgi:hypothetical protein